MTKEVKSDNLVQTLPQRRGVLDISNTMLIKGVACLLLLIHHLFSSTNTFSYFTSLAYVKGEPLEALIAGLCRVCVTMFLFLSGFGVNESLNKKLTNATKPMKVIFRSSLRLTWKLWAGYIAVFLLFVPWQGLFGRQPYTSAVQVVIDVLGFAYLFGTPTMNSTWWYMSVALASYLFTIFFKPLLKRYKALTIGLAVLLYTGYLMLGGVFWSYAYLLGMLFSEYRFFDVVSAKEAKPFYKWMVCGMLVVCTALLRYLSPVWMDFPFALSIILFCLMCLSAIPYLNKALMFLGKHSANIFLMHSFIYWYNFRQWIYAPKYAILIALWLTGVSTLVSIVVEFVKKVTGYNKLTDFIGKKIGGN